MARRADPKAPREGRLKGAPSVDEAAALLGALNANPDTQPTTENLLARVRANRKRERIKRVRPESEFPELLVTVPDSWETVQLAPLYDVHMGHGRHDAEMFARHLRWIRETPNVLTWNGGDMIENASKLSVGAGVYEQTMKPQSQFVSAIHKLTGIAHKMLFSLPGNHEDRTDVLGYSVAAWMGALLEVPYFSDYCFCTLMWRGNRFRILAHHGTGAANSAGGQRMAARKDIAWAKPFDLIWTGHLHAPLIDPIYQTDFDQKTGRVFERTGLIFISPSYLKFFGTYAAKARYTPGHRGLASVVLREDGRIDSQVHANGRRL